ncbi:inter-alpha-trypsin inhibitor heavy chain H4 [Ochotona curzoniae]|uniref:inter-alpha-trypsin inhibitor heavy chain H4 n=1 Tax=Ochotona curzoniae TaxID=130825 RepID=UPI001B350959|nr:inter-alpha-trypsin inhibitor heavy chain H4 [Ochotona curzoniae]
METPARVCTWVLVLSLLLLHAGLQTATVPHESGGIDIYSLTVHSEVSARFARTVITSRVVNRAETVQEAAFQIELPRKAFITNFSMTIDGVTYPGIVREKAAAQEQYSAAKARGESASLVKTTERKMERFEVSVSVAAASKVTFKLVYEELLRRRLGAYELLFKVQPQQLVQHLQVDVHIFEPQGISFLETESSFMTKELEEALITSQNETKAHIQFRPTLSQQQQSGGLLNGNFIIRYDVIHTPSGGSIQIENGYFVHHFAPDGLPALSKNVIFVIDSSGSMLGRKIEQTQEALIKILDDLSTKDRFNLIVFNRVAWLWKPRLLQASVENVRKAKSYTASIVAQGGTNINEAMLKAVQLLDSERAELHPRSVSLMILLTDGDPTEGVTNLEMIQRNVREAIGGHYSLFCLGFGFDVHYSFLEKLALDNGGLARRIYEDSDAALQLQDFYQEVAQPLLMSVSFEYLSNAVEEVTQDNFQFHFMGSEMVVAGKLRPQSPAVLSAKVSGQGQSENITFYVESGTAEQEEALRGRQYVFGSFMERLWAYLTIEQLLEQIVSAPKAEQQALESRARNLSLNYNFVTPFTAMVVTKPEGQEQSQVVEKPTEEEKKHSAAHPGSFALSKVHRKGRKHYNPTGSRVKMSSQFGVYGSPARFRRPHPQGPRQFSYGGPHPTYGGPHPTYGGPHPTYGGPHPAYGGPHPAYGGPHPTYESFLPDSVLDLFDTKNLPRLPKWRLYTPTPVAASVPFIPSATRLTKVVEMDTEDQGITMPNPTSAPSQAPSIFLPVHGPGVDQLCVDIRSSQGPINLISDPDQGIKVTGQYEVKTGFSWVKVMVKNPELQVHATPEHVVVTRNRRSSEYKWMKTMFSTLPNLKITMDSTGLLLISGPHRVTVGLLPWGDHKTGLLLLLRHTDRFSRNVRGTIGQFYPTVLLSPSSTKENQWILKAQADDYVVTREHRLDYQEGPPGKETACWNVRL